MIMMTLYMYILIDMCSTVHAHCMYPIPLIIFRMNTLCRLSSFSYHNYNQLVMYSYLLPLFIVIITCYSCSKLEELDVSYYLTITDDEVRLLAQSCPHMMIFNAKESHFLSDQSILALSRHCPGICLFDWLHLTLHICI